MNKNWEGDAMLRGSMDVELSPEQVSALLRIADGDRDVDAIREDDLTRLQALTLIEQRGVSFGLTAIGFQTVAWIRSR
jgi:hypothetical protein